MGVGLQLIRAAGTAVHDACQRAAPTRALGQRRVEERAKAQDKSRVHLDPASTLDCHLSLLAWWHFQSNCG